MRTQERPAAVAAERTEGSPRRPPLPSPVDARTRSLAWGSSHALTPEDARALIAAVSPTSPTGARNRALLAMMYRSGLRPGEVLSLAVGDIDAAARTVTVRSGRARGRRTTGVDEATLDLIAAWLEVRRARRIPRRAPLFCTLAGARLTGAYLRQLTARLARRSGIRARVHPMALRYANAAELADEGVLRMVIERHLGLAPSSHRLATEGDAVRAIVGRRWAVPALRPSTPGGSALGGGPSGRP